MRSARLLLDQRDHLVALSEHPRQRERGDADALLGRDRLEPGDHLEVALEVRPAVAPCRQSSGLRSSGRRNRPVSSPRERGLYATKAIRARGRAGACRPPARGAAASTRSGPRRSGVAWVCRTRLGSESPTYRCALPAATRSAIAPDSSMGTSVDPVQGGTSTCTTPRRARLASIARRRCSGLPGSTWWTPRPRRGGRRSRDPRAPRWSRSRKTRPCR